MRLTGGNVNGIRTYSGEIQQLLTEPQRRDFRTRATCWLCDDENDSKKFIWKLIDELLTQTNFCEDRRVAGV